MAFPDFGTANSFKELFMRSGRLAVVGVAALLLVASVAVADQPISTDTAPWHVAKVIGAIRRGTGRRQRQKQAPKNTCTLNCSSTRLPMQARKPSSASSTSAATKSASCGVGTGLAPCWSSTAIGGAWSGCTSRAMGIASRSSPRLPRRRRWSASRRWSNPSRSTFTLPREKNTSWLRSRAALWLTPHRWWSIVGTSLSMSSPATSWSCGPGDITTARVTWSSSVAAAA